MTSLHSPNGLASWVTCVCGKRGYGSKGVAKKRARHHEGDTKKQLRQYRCPTSGMWHNGHLPDAVMRGALTRGDIWPRKDAS